MADIPSSSITVFKQSTALTGWTKLTSINDYTLRVVSGTVSTGGTKSFSQTFTTVVPTGSVSGSGTTGEVSLSESQIPSHTHSYTSTPAPSFPTTANYKLQSPTGSSTLAVAPRATFSYNMSPAGSSTPHSHPITVSVSSPGFTGSALNFDVKYVDVILAQRN